MAFFKKEERLQNGKQEESRSKSVDVKDFLHSTILLEEALAVAIVAEMTALKKLKRVVSDQFMINIKKDLSNTLKLAHNKSSMMEMLTEEIGDCSELIYAYENPQMEAREEDYQDPHEPEESEASMTESLITEIASEAARALEETEVLIELAEESPFQEKQEHRKHEMISLKRPPKRKRSKAKLNKEKHLPAKSAPVEPEPHVDFVEHRPEPVTTKPWIAPSCYVPIQS